MTRIKLLLVSIAVLVTSMAIPCCAVSTSNVRFGDQANIVVWDAAKGVEHFFRTAKFQTESEDFGFIAPTPSIPAIGEADAESLNIVQSLKPPPPPSNGTKSALHSLTAGMSSGAVTVIQVGRAAGYEITTLKASDSAALSSWLRSHDYKTSPSIESWIRVYVDKGWYLSAFKFVAESGSAQTKIVRLSFPTEKPFSPFFVPEDNQGRSSKQDVFFVSTGVYKGTVKNYRYPPTFWATRLGSSADRLKNALGLRESFLNPDSVVTHFSSRFPTSAQDDIFFHLDSDQSTGWRFVPKPNELFNGVVTVLLFLALAIGVHVFIKKFKEA